jgi:hypothetical protein
VETNHIHQPYSNEYLLASPPDHQITNVNQTESHMDWESNHVINEGQVKEESEQEAEQEQEREQVAETMQWVIYICQ